MDTEILFYVPPQRTEAGTMPGFYECVSPRYAPDVRAMGGRDVSNDPQAWRDYEAQLRAENECYL